MTDKTPKKNTSTLNGFLPVILPVSPAVCSPQKNLTGSPRIARDIIADLYNNIQHWNDFHLKGANIIKEIAILKSISPKSYSAQLEEYMNSLYDIVSSLLVYRNNFDNLLSQIRALSKLHEESDVLFISLNVNQLANLVETICHAYNNEFILKETILENIAHTEDKHEVIFYSACWIYQFTTCDSNFKLETLLTETGHRKCV